MIAKRVERHQDKKSNIRDLAYYILDIKNGGKKVQVSWLRNCQTNKNELAVKEMEATQAMNTRSQKDKNYHLIISFQAGENPPEETLREIEEHVCKAIGYGEHQRVVAVHNDTDNLHIHVAINKIHPGNFKAIEPYYDKFKLDRACLECELKYGLQRDNRIDPGRQKNGPNQKDHSLDAEEGIRESVTQPRAGGRAGDMEAHSGIESFQSWIKENATPVIDALLSGSDPSWEKLHTELAALNLEFRERGAGFVISHREKKLFVKASSVSRGYSKKSLEDRLGPFQKLSPGQSQIKVRVSYQARPVHRHKKRDDLYEAYKREKQAMIDAKKEKLEALRLENTERLKGIRQEYQKKRAEVKTDKLIRRKMPVYSNLKERRLLSISELRTEMASRRLKVHNDARVLTWQDYLVKEASRGNTTALEVLRSRKKRPSPDLNTDSVTGKDIRSGKIFDDYEREVKKNGDVLYKVGYGVSIRDNGDKLKLEGLNYQAVEAVTKMAVSKFGNTIDVSGSEEFREAVIQVVTRKKLDVRFSDQKMEARRKSIIKGKGLSL